MPKPERTKKQEHCDQYAVVLEDLRSEFRVFGEGLGAARETSKSTFEAISETKEDMQEVKEELHIIRNELKEKVG